MFLSDLSANEENYNIKNKEPQQIECPPTLKSNSSKIIIIIFKLQFIYSVKLNTKNIF